MDTSPRQLIPSIPIYSTNGQPSSSSPATTRDSKERQRLYSSISASGSRRRHSIALDDIENPGPSNHQYSRDATLLSRKQDKDSENSLEVLGEEAPRDLRDLAGPLTPSATSRADSPYTVGSTVDFDGLSWPSESMQDYKLRGLQIDSTYH